jgi:putative ABC transport system permease protein
MVKKYFGNEEPMGKIINYSTSSSFRVTGVLKNIPGNSHFIMDFVIPFKKYEQLSGLDLSKWNYRICVTYFLLSKEADPAEFLKKIHLIYKQNRPDDVASGNVRKHFLQPLTKIHLHSNCDGELGVNNSIRNIYTFITIAFLILIIASINYMNLATARSVQRGKEVGVRKVIGAQRRQLLQQFLGESAVLTLLAFILSMIIVMLVLPIFNSFTERDIFINFGEGLHYLIILIPVVVFVIFFAGSYPALFISSYSPVSVLRGSFRGSSPGKRLRSLLVVLQFTISIVLIFSSLVIKTQLNFVRNADVGYNKDQIVVLRTNKESQPKLETIKTELKRNQNILAVSSSTYLPSQIDDQTNLDWPGRPKDLAYFDIYLNIVDYDFVDLYGIKITKGRNFSQDFPDDANGAFIFNEALVKTLGWETPTGREVTRPRFREKSIKGKVVGVVKNFNFHSLHRNIQPLYLFLGPTERQYLLSVKLKGKNIPAALNFLERKMKEFAPSYPFEYRFFDEIFDRAYKSEQNLGVMFNSFSLLAIFIASLGLFGLAAFTAEQRTKEIGIRKVLGAKVTSIVALLSKEFSKWVILANLIAWPVAGYVMYRWLQRFAYRISLELWIFVLSAAIALIIAVLTVIFQALKAAKTNPVNSLKYE